MSRIWTLHFFTVALLCAAVGGLPTAEPNINMTISVPPGTSDHGDPNLLCTPTKWLDILIFFFANYLAHAATVKALPGECAEDLAFAVLLAIAFPFSGVARGLEAVMRHASLYRHSNDLRTAARAGALCIVVRTESWVPDSSQNSVIKGLKVVRRRDSASAQGSVDPKTALFKMAEGEFKLDDVPVSRKVHGLSEPGKGYRLALLPSNIDVIPKCTHNTGRRKKPILSSSYSIPQIMVAIVQLIYASYTLYKTRGDQLNRYGYAAFGLTVIPFIIMSFLNLLGNILTPNYPALYLVSSPELEEAVSRAYSPDTRIDGVIGTVVGGTRDTSEGLFEGRMISHGPKASRLLQVLTDSKETSPSQPRAHSADVVPVPVLISDGESYELQGSKSESEFEISFPEYSPLQAIKDEKPYRNPGLPLWGFMVFFLGAIPYTVIGGLTHFQAAQSTQAQRVFTMFWLASGVFIGSTIPFISFGFQEMIDIVIDLLVYFVITMVKYGPRKITAGINMRGVDIGIGIEVGEGIREERIRYGIRIKMGVETGIGPVASYESQKKTEYYEGDEMVKTYAGNRMYGIEMESIYVLKRDRMITTRQLMTGVPRIVRAMTTGRDKAGSMFRFLGSLVFSAAAVGGFVTVGQMLKGYGSYHYVEFHKHVLNIIDWGKGNRLKEIRDSLESLLEESRKRTSEAAKSRPPPSDGSGTSSKSPRRAEEAAKPKAHNDPRTTAQVTCIRNGDETIGRWFHRNADGTLSWAEEEGRSTSAASAE